MENGLTKLDIAAIRGADDICVHLTPTLTKGLVRLIKRKPMFGNDPFAQDIEHKMTANVQLEGMRGQDELRNGLVQCFAMSGIHHCQHTNASLALKSLRIGDEVTFSFWPDAHTNGYLAAAGLHGDGLYMHVRRNGKTIARWEITQSICPSNSARMVRGVPNSENYERDAMEARRVA